MTPTDARPPAEGGPPAPEAPAPDAPAEPPFPSGAAVREAHAALAGLDPPPAAGAVRRFIARVRATGAGLVARAERVEAQTVINYWANTLVALPVSEARKLSAAETTLDRFDAAAAPDLSDKECPFKGLAAFAESDAGRFFGRDEAIAELVERVAQFPLVLVTGPSGAGKSSLVLAGVLPALAERAVDPKPLVLPVVVPGADPLGALAGAVRSQPRPPGAGALDSSRLAWSAADFRTALAARAGARPVVLVLDQFEEVFTLCESREARGAFAAAVAAVAGAPGNRVIVIVREDYLGQALQLDALKPLTADPGARFAPPPMSSRELRRAVERPAELVGLKFDDGIVDELVKEVVGEATALPLLQFALAKVWENKNRNRITWDVYRAVGSPREALKRTADAVYAQLPQDIDRDVTRLVFLDLVRPTAGVEVVRRRVRREVLRRHAAANTVDGVLRRWEAAGLLRETKGTEPADDRFEVAHEALTRNWPLLAGWLEEKRRTAERELQLASAAKLWADSGRKDGFLLQGAALEEAAGYATASPEVAELVRESRAEQERDSRRKVAIRRRAIIVLSVLCVALATLSFFTWRGWSKAEERLTRAVTAEEKQKIAAGEATNEKEIAGVERDKATAARGVADQKSRDAFDAQRQAEKDRDQFAQLLGKIIDDKERGELNNPNRIKVYRKQYEALTGVDRIRNATRSTAGPLQMGASIGYLRDGTKERLTGSACCVVQGAGGARFVLAAGLRASEQYDAVVTRPGPEDGGTLQQRIGVLRAVGLDVQQMPNRPATDPDWANQYLLIPLDSQVKAENRLPSSNTPVKEVAPKVTPGEALTLYGRGSGQARLEVLRVSADGVVITSRRSQIGDAGGAVLNDQNQLVGLHIRAVGEEEVVLLVRPILDRRGLKFLPANE